MRAAIQLWACVAAVGSIGQALMSALAWMTGLDTESEVPIRSQRSRDMLTWIVIVVLCIVAILSK